ncbi:SPOR domain-containing protein [Thalassospira sp.]|uniref:SPOR domain-containing protein n=1 Tax=Thalassospira sp. TaxID=1912094 RepID=UPI000C5B541B|nr:SPOR domain-containing protein [Thalassospira sp.]MBC08021.1 energy transducer TonB [Thalassospira sp.]
MSEEHGSDLHAERGDHYGSERPAGKSMIKGLATVVLGLVVVGGALGGAGYWFYNQGQPIQDDGNLPILLPDPSPIKIRPEDPGGMEVPHRETTVYDQLSDVDPDANVVLQELPDMPRAPEVSATPKMAEPEETAEAPSETSGAATAEATQTAEPEAETAVEAPEITAPELTDAEKAVAAAENRAAEPQAPAAQKAASEQAVAPSGAFRVQLASVREESGAAAEWKRLSGKNKDLLGNLEMFVQRIEIEGKGVFYRLQAGPLGDSAAAEKLCADLKERSVGCLIVRP